MIKILITGDFNPSEQIEELIKQGNSDKMYSDFNSVLEGNDLNVTNLECPLYDKDTSIQKIGPRLKASTGTVAGLKYANFNLVTLANNHIMDHGTGGLISTINSCLDNGIDTVGAGMNFGEARKPYYKTIQNKTFAIINITENEFSTTTDNEPGANGLNPVANFYDITEARKKADFVFVIVHGGIEHYLHPSPRVQETYRFFIDIGASAVIGHHTHCFQGYEIYKNSPIFYSLGNFIFPALSNRMPKTWYSGYSVKLIIDNDSLKFQIIPYKQGLEKIGIQLLNNEELTEFENKIAWMNKTLLYKESLQNEFEGYCKTQVTDYKTFFEPYNGRITQFLYKKGLLPSLTTRCKSVLLYNVIHCEAHREITLNILNRSRKKLK
jgi:hypothetical protein